jgi:putative peptidoglycan binding protein
VPRRIASDDEMPRRRRRRAANAVAAETEHGFLVRILLRILLRSPKDAIAGLIAFAAVSAIIANALFLQAGRHPAPMFGSLAMTPANPLPRPRPVEADGTLLEPRPTESKVAEPKAAEPKTGDPLANLVKATSGAPATPSNASRPSAPMPAASHSDAVQITGSRRVAAVQHVLTEYGYGQLRATGTIGSDTQAAIQKFERDHKIPVTGQMSDRLVRELTAMVGHPID